MTRHSLFPARTVLRASRRRAAWTLLTVIGLAATTIVGAAEAPGRAADPSAVIDRYLDAYAAADTTSLGALYAEDTVFVDVSQRHEVEGREAMTAQLQQLFAIHKSVGVEEVRRAADGSLITIEVVYTGTLDCAAMGRPDHPDVTYRLPAVLLFDVEGGRIQKQTDYLDFRTFTESFGALMPPA